MFQHHSESSLTVLRNYLQYQKEKVFALTSALVCLAMAVSDTGKIMLLTCIVDLVQFQLFTDPPL